MENKKCLYCGAEITSGRDSKKFCNNSHRVLYWQKSKIEKIERRANIPPNHYVVTEMEKLTIDRLNVICGGKMTVMSALDLFAQFLKNYQNGTTTTFTDR